jgi:hypothetical protein
VIPHTIHQIWIGSDDPPTEMLSTWPTLHPDWEYKLWRDDDLAALDMTNRVLYDDLYSQQLWSGAADVARAEILHSLGGVYVDADTVALRALDNAPFMDSEFFIAEEHRDPQPFLLNCCATGSVKLSKPISDVVSSLTTVDPSPRNYSQTWVVTGPTRWTKILRDRDDVTVVPPGAFMSHTVYGEPIEYAGPKYADHKFGISYDRPDVTVVIPFGDAHENRARVLRWLEIYWQHHMTFAEFIVQPFEELSKTYTLNRGIERASGNIIVTMDADCLMDPHQLYDAIEIARRPEPSWAMPYSYMYRLRMSDTETVLDLDPWTFQPELQINENILRQREQARAVHFGAMCQVFPKAAWESFGGFDERFKGWGTEDEAMKMTLDTMWADSHLLPGNVFHLEHDRPGANLSGVGNGWDRKWQGQEIASPNLDLRNEYARATGNKAALKVILAQR